MQRVGEEFIAETRAYNEAMTRRLAALPPAASIAESRLRLRNGAGATPRGMSSPRAQSSTITGRSGAPIGLRTIAAAEPNGIFLHVHGGGWAIGANDLQDGFLEGLADRAGLTCVSVDYRLAPEHPYPAAIDDCEDAALWLIAHAASRLGTSRLFIGGESAGAHLAAAVLLRLRDGGRGAAFSGACLSYGFFDLNLTPSARAAQSTPVIDRTSLARRARDFSAGGTDLADPRISPLNADLADLPPALFVVGSEDPLLDDSTLMHARWSAAGSPATLRLYEGATHGFLLFPIDVARLAARDIADFLRGL